jgi:hypothetical protein
MHIDCFTNDVNRVRSVNTAIFASQQESGDIIFTTMDSGTEILRVTAAIVSAFQSAADTLEVIKDRKEKKKRRKDKDVEELLEIKILHKSLVEVSIFNHK